MISDAKIKKLESKMDDLDLARKRQEEYARRMFPNEKKFYRFMGGLIPESDLKRITENNRNRNRNRIIE